MAGLVGGNPAVLIVGAGPVGLAMAVELSRHGVACRIVDENPGPTDQSRALGIQARTLEVFDDWGVVDEVLARGRKLRGMAAFADGRRLVHLTFDLEGLETHYPYLLILPQGQTEQILAGRLREFGIEVERQTRLVGLRQDGSGVSATLVDAEGRSSESRTPWLIGTDGARSAVRKGLKLPFEGAEYEDQFLLADVRLAWDRPDDEITAHLTPDGPIVAFPFAEPGRWRLVDASAPPGVEADPASVVERFRAILHAQGRTEAVVSDPTWTASFRIHRRVVERFRRGRCFLAGDAAHIHSPAGGQGMNTGIQDAYNLAWKLALVTRGAAPEALLDSYSAERRPVAASVIHGTDRATRLLTLRDPVARSIRDHLAGLLGEFDFVARRISRGISELDVGYRRSPIVAEDVAGPLRAGLLDALDFHDGPRPGDRVPDVPLEPPSGAEGPARLFDVLRGTKHVLLLFDGTHPTDDPGPTQAVLDLVSRLPDAVEAYRVRKDEAPSRDGRTLLDPSGELHRRFGARGPCLYLVRPDGHLGYRALPPDPGRLAAYLTRIFAREAQPA